LEAFVILCGGTSDPTASNDGLDGIMNENASKKSSSSALDKYTMQEKIIPLIRAIKTKEPAVAIAALNVLRQVGGIVDADFVAMEILPVLWSMSLGPLLDLKQFQSFMELIKSLSSRVESEQTRKLQELSGSNGSRTKGNDDFMSFGATSAFRASNGGSDGAEVDFERLVKGTAGNSDSSNPMDPGWDSAPANATAQPLRNVSNQPKAASFAWSTPTPSTPFFSGNSSSMGVLRPQQGPASRTITPDLSRFDALSPTSTQFSQPLQPQSSFNVPPLQPQSNYNTAPLQPQPLSSFQIPPPSSMNWGTTTSNPWASNNTPASNPSLSSMANLGNSMSNMSMNQRPAITSLGNSFSLPPPPGTSSYGAAQQTNLSSAFGRQSQVKPPVQKSSLDAYESLLWGLENGVDIEANEQESDYYDYLWLLRHFVFVNTVVTYNTN
jgi:SCY1-like protein 2